MDGHEGERQARVVRIFIFEDKPEFILLYVPTGMSASLPTSIASPFDKGKIKIDFGAAGADVRVTQTHAAPWNKTMKLAKSAERSEANQRQDEAVAAEAKLMLGSSSATIRDRSRVILRKQDVDSEIRALKSEIKDAKAKAYKHRVYMDRKVFLEKEARLDFLQKESQGLQMLMGTLRRAEHDENRQQSESEMRAFLRKARAMLPRETFREIADAADITPEDDVSDGEVSA